MMVGSGASSNGGGSVHGEETPLMSSSPPPQQPLKHSPAILTGSPRLVALQEPQENFHKDEGGKANQLSYRIILQGELSPEILANAVDGCLPLSARPIFDDGDLADPSVIDIVGGTDGTNPCIQLRSRLGGVRYRLKTVSKRLGNRGIGVVVQVAGCPSIEPIRSEPTMVFSKRKNKEQRLEEQARERNELLERQRAAQLLLSARSSPSASIEAAPSTLSPEKSPGELAPPPKVSTNIIKFPPSLMGTHGLPAPFVPAAPAIVRPRPRRVSRDKDHETDSEASFDSAANSSTNASKRRKTRNANGSAGRQSRSLEDRVAKLEAALEANVKEVEEMRAAMNLCFYQLGGTANAAGLRRSSSQNVPWEFSEPNSNFDSHGSVRDQLVGGLTMVSPQPARSPFEIDSWVNGNGNEPLRLRRDISSGLNQLPSPRSTSGVSAPLPRRSPSSEAL